MITKYKPKPVKNVKLNKNHKLSKGLVAWELFNEKPKR